MQSTRFLDLCGRAEYTPDDRPVLFQVDEHDNVVAFVGVSLARKLASEIGIRQALQVAKSLGRSSLNEDAIQNPGRRFVMKQMIGAGIAGALLGAGKSGALAKIAGTDLESMSNQPKLSELSNARAQKFLALLSSSEDRLAYEEWLTLQGFSPTEETRLLRVDGAKKLVREVSYQVWNYPNDSSKQALLQVSREADSGKIVWFPRIIENGRVRRQLQLVDGRVTTFQVAEDEAVAPNGWWPSACTICKKGCDYGLTAVTVGGCIASCSSICGPAAFVCAGVCSAICSKIFDEGIVSTCPDACAQLGFC